MIHIKTYGCSNNLAESEMMHGILEKAGYIITENEHEAETIIFNACTVKGDTVILRDLRKTHKHKKIIVAGCIPQTTIPSIKEIVPHAGLINTHNFDKILDVVKATENNESYEALDYDYKTKLNFPQTRKNFLIGIVPILNSCANACSFCSVKRVKGKLKTFPEEMIRNHVKQHITHGAQEIWLTSQDNGAYGLDTEGTRTLPRLLKTILDIGGTTRIRTGMMNPQHAIKMIPELIEVFHHERIYKFLHVCVQSGSNDVLKRMNRGHTVEDFTETVNAFRKVFPLITIATDIIVGYPGETEKEFQETIDMIRQVKPEVVNISRFVSIPDTIAARQPYHINGRIIKERSRVLTKVFEEIAHEQRKKWLHITGNVFVNEIGKQNTMIGRNDAYQQVILPENTSLGAEVTVTIIETRMYDLIGTIISSKE